ncbi:MAG: hypothetical protein R6U28_02390 [Cyclonatronaceae bacterium]
MIIPPKKQNPVKGFFSLLFTVAFCAAAYFILVTSTISDPDATQLQMRELTQINLTRFQPPIEEPEPEQPEAEDPVPEEEPVREMEMEETAPARVDLSDVLPDGFRLAEPDAQTPDSRTQQTPDMDETSALAIEDRDITLSDRDHSLSAGDLAGIASNRSRRIDDDLGPRIGMDDPSDIRIGRRGISDNGDTGSLLGTPGTREQQPGPAEVDVRDLEDFGADYSDIGTMYFPLAEWMRSNSTELPVAVRRLMTDGRWDDNYLTSQTSFYIDDREYQLLLMTREELREVHIVLVQGNNAIYLIDRGFQQESNYLRVGEVGFRGDEIAEVDSEMRDAGREHTEEFYQIFLSWWNSVDM